MQFGNEGPMGGVIGGNEGSMGAALELTDFGPSAPGSSASSSAEPANRAAALYSSSSSSSSSANKGAAAKRPDNIPRNGILRSRGSIAHAHGHASNCDGSDGSNVHVGFRAQREEKHETQKNQNGSERWRARSQEQDLLDSVRSGAYRLNFFTAASLSQYHKAKAHWAGVDVATQVDEEFTNINNNSEAQVTAEAGGAEADGADADAGSASVSLEHKASAGGGGGAGKTKTGVQPRTKWIYGAGSRCDRLVDKVFSSSGQRQSSCAGAGSRFSTARLHAFDDGKNRDKQAKNKNTKTNSNPTQTAIQCKPSPSTVVEPTAVEELHVHAVDPADGRALTVSAHARASVRFQVHHEILSPNATGSQSTGCENDGNVEPVVSKSKSKSGGSESRASSKGSNSARGGSRAASKESRSEATVDVSWGTHLTQSEATVANCSASAIEKTKTKIEQKSIDPKLRELSHEHLRLKLEIRTLLLATEHGESACQATENATEKQSESATLAKLEALRAREESLQLQLDLFAESAAESTTSGAETETCRPVAAALQNEGDTSATQKTGSDLDLAVLQKEERQLSRQIEEIARKMERRSKAERHGRPRTESGQTQSRTEEEEELGADLARGRSAEEGTVPHAAEDAEEGSLRERNFPNRMFASRH